MVDGVKIRARREQLGWSQQDLANRVGTSQQTIDRIEGGITLHSRSLPAILKALEIDTPGQLVGAVNYRPPPQFFGERDLPVFSAVEGGSGEMVVSTDPVEIVPRPWYMREVKDGFAVLITGESMEPAFEPGDMAIVNPRLPPMRNKNTIFVSGEERGEFKATIKRLVNWTSDSWNVRQFNEPKDFQLQRKMWTRALRVVGKLEGG